MPQPKATTFNRDQADIVQKFARLPRSTTEIESNDEALTRFFEVKVIALNLIARTAGETSNYFRQLISMGGDETRINPFVLRGILVAAGRAHLLESCVRVNYAIVFVSDMKKGVAFYRDVLGLPLKLETPHWTEFATEGATLALHGDRFFFASRIDFAYS